MKKNRILSILLSLTLLFSSSIANTKVHAHGNTNNEACKTEGGMVICKTATDMGNGDYEIELEAYATGEKVTTIIEEDIPADIVLVLDQSGSMTTKMASTIEFVSLGIQTNSENYSNRNNILFLLTNGAYSPVTVNRVQDGWDGWYREYKYTYTYEDINGDNVSYISEGRNTHYQTEFFKQITVEGPTRLEALKAALGNFISQVEEQAKGDDNTLGTADDVNHRIAVVGFASGLSWRGTNYYYGNTELLIGSNQYTYNAGSANNPADPNSAQSHYGSAFQNMNITAEAARVKASKDALTAEGGTIMNLGVEMANGIFAANAIDPGETRNRIMVVFTDGVPGWSGYDQTIANETITQANITKTTHDATVYTVGVFTGADATSAGNQSGNETQKANWFMQNLSSNEGLVQDPSYYLSASDATTLNNIFQSISDTIEGGGADVTLTGSTVIKDVIAPAFKLPDTATAASIQLKTYKYTAEDTWVENVGDNLGASASINSARDQVNVTGFNFSEHYVGPIIVDGVTTGYRGNKLVITFTINAKDEFLGGNQVFTNTRADVFENNTVENPSFTFVRPKVDVPIKDIVQTVPSRNVYLGKTLTIGELAVAGQATVKVGDVELKLTEANYGLEPWQHEYVDIEMKIDANDVLVAGQPNVNLMSDFVELTDDKSFTLSTSVQAKYTGTVTGASSSGTGSVKVFKPTITYEDGYVYYGGNLLSQAELDTYRDPNIVWYGRDSLNNLVTDQDVTMTGLEPTLTYQYTQYYDAIKPITNNGAGLITDPVYNTKQDVGVDVGVSVEHVGQVLRSIAPGNVSFIHTPCNPACDYDVNRGYEFLLHIKTKSITITKTGGIAGEPYAFTILKDGVDYSAATIIGNSSVTIHELPLGNYTIKEDMDWSWRFEDLNNMTVTLSQGIQNGQVTAANTLDDEKDKWLNDYSEVEVNTYGVPR